MIATLTDNDVILFHGEVNQLLEYCSKISYEIAKAAYEAANTNVRCGYIIGKSGLLYKVEFYIENNNKKIKIRKDVLQAAVEYMNTKSLINN
jgi:hypothetical protein